MEHELAAVKEILQRLNEAGDVEEPAQGDEDAWSDEDDALAAGPSVPAATEKPAASSAAGTAAGTGAGLAEPVAGSEDMAAGVSGQAGAGAEEAGQLQRAIMARRLTGLQSRQRELEVSFLFAQLLPSRLQHS